MKQLFRMVEKGCQRSAGRLMHLAAQDEEVYQALRARIREIRSMYQRANAEDARESENLDPEYQVEVSDRSLLLWSATEALREVLRRARQIRECSR